MEWSKIKTILICIFVVVNAFLFTVYFKGMYVDTTLDDQVVENTITILSQNNIAIDKYVMPKTHANAKVCSVENKYNSVSVMLEAARRISEEKGVQYLDDDSTKVRGNTFICAVNENNNVLNPTKYAKKEMKKTGLLEDVEYSVHERDGYVYFYLKFEDKIFYDSYIRVNVTEKGIQEIYGHNWMGDTITEGGLAETVSPAQILIDFATDINTEKEITVDSVKAGYYIGDRDETVRVTAFPVWEITLSDGRIYYYDMRNGDLLNSNEI